MPVFSAYGEPGEGWRAWYASSPVYDQFGLHKHEGYEFYLHVRNGHAYQLEGQVELLDPLQLLIIRPQQPHGLVGSEPLQGYERLHVQVHPQVLQQLGFEGTSVKDIVDHYCERMPAKVYMTMQDYLHIRTIAASLKPASEIEGPLEHMEALGYLSIILSRFCQALTAARQRHIAPKDTLMQDVGNHILERFAEDCSLDALADRFNISKFHLSHRFTNTYGMSIHQYVLHCRIAYAQMLIRQSKPLNTICYQCGFNDYSAFLRAFQRVTGLTPRAWRKTALSPAKPTLSLPPIT